MKLVVPLLSILPLLISAPAILSVPPKAMVRVVLLLIVRFLQDALPVMVGILVAPAAMTTFVVELGTVPEHQLSAVAQSLLTLPVHCPASVDESTLVYAVVVQPPAVTVTVYVPASAEA